MLMEKDSEREWFVEVEKLIDVFKETRNLLMTSGVCCIFMVVCVEDVSH